MRNAKLTLSFSVCLSLFVLAAGSLRADTVRHSDDFSGTLAAWTAYEGNWHITDGKLQGDYDVSCGSTGCPQGDLVLKDEFQPRTSDWRMEMDFYFVNHPGYYYNEAQAVFGLWQNGSVKQSYSMGYAADYWDGAPRTTIPWGSEFGLPWGTWNESGTATIAWSPLSGNHATLEKRGAQVSIFLNGTLLHTFPAPQISGAYKLGLHIYGSQLVDNFKLTELDPLPAGLVAYYPFDGNAYDSSGNGHHGTPHATTATTDRFGNPNAAYRFDGISSYVEAPQAFDIQNQMTIAAWVLLDSVQTSSWQSLFMTESYLSNFGLMYNSELGQPTTFNNAARWIVDYAFPRDAWFHLALTYDGSEVRLFVDGRKVWEYAYSEPLTDGSRLLIGAQNSTAFNYWLKGKMDEFRVYDRPLSPSEIEILAGGGLLTSGPGWRRQRCDSAGSNQYPYSSTLLTNDELVQRWTNSNGNGRVLTGDVNGDGYLELVQVSGNQLRIYKHDGTILKTVTLGTGTGLLGLLDDWDGDGIDDIGIGSYVTSDLKAFIYSGSGTLLKTYSRSGGYDSSMTPVEFLPNGNVVMELRSGYACGPRGLSVFNKTTGAELWYYSMGPDGALSSIADINGDGLLEMTTSMYTPHNGCSGNGWNGNGAVTTDGDMWTIVVDEQGNQEFSRIFPAPSDSGASHYFVDLDKNGQKEVLILEGHYYVYPGTAEVHLLSSTGTPEYTFTGPADVGLYGSIVDLDGDGKDEVVVSSDAASNRLLYVLDEHLQLQASAPVEGILRLVADLNGDGAKEAVTYESSTGIVRIYSSSLSLLDSHQVAAGGSEWLVVSDNDLDGVLDLVVSNSAGMWVLENTGAQSATRGWKHPRYDLAGSNQYPFGSSVRTPDDLAQLWSSSAAGGAALTGDVNGDGYLEVVHVAGSQLRIFSYSGALLKSVTLGSSDCLLKLLGDWNGDGVDDIGIGTRNTTSLKTYFYDGSGNLLKTYSRAGGYDSTMSPRGLLPNGNVVMELRSGYACSPRGFAVFDKTTGAELWYYSMGPDGEIGSIADVDADGLLEITSNLYTPHNGCSGNGWNGNGTTTTDGDLWTIVVDQAGAQGFSRIFDAPRDGGASHYFTDLDRNGQKEVLVLEGHAAVYPGTAQVHLLSPTGSPLYSYSYSGTSNVHWYGSVVDLDGDGKDEVVVGTDASTDRRIHVLDETLQLQASAPIVGIVELVTDLNGDGAKEIVTSDSDGGTIRVYSASLALLDSYAVTTGSGPRVIASDINLDGRVELVVVNSSGLFVLVNQGATGCAAEAGLDEATCLAAPAFTLNGGTPSGGTWSGPGIVNASTGSFDPTTAGLGTHTVIYSYSDGSGCTTSDSKVVTVRAGATISQSPTSLDLCEGEPSSLSVTAAGATSYQWKKWTEGLTVDASVGGNPMVAHGEFGSGKVVVTFAIGWSHDATWPGNAYRSNIYQASNLLFLQKVIGYLSGTGTSRILFLRINDPSTWTVPGGSGSLAREIQEWQTNGYTVTTRDLSTTMLDASLLSNYDVVRIMGGGWSHPFAASERDALDTWVRGGGRAFLEIGLNQHAFVLTKLGVTRIDGNGGGGSGLDWTYHGAPWTYGPVTGPLAVPSMAAEAADRPVVALGEWNPVSGATGTTYSIGVVTLADAGTYRCDVADPCGTTPSGSATISVSPSPAGFAITPDSATLCAGTPVNLDAGTGFASYLWSSDPPSSSRIAFASNRTGDFEIWTMNEDGSSQSRLVARPGSSDRSPRWSPDGSKVAFLSDEAGQMEPWIVNADGGNARRLVDLPALGATAAGGALSWSPGGDFLFYEAQLSATDSQIRRLAVGPDAPYVFQDDFTSISLTSWNIDGGTWSTSGGLLDSGYSSGSSCATIVSSSTFADTITLEARLRNTPGGNPCGAVHLLFGREDADDYFDAEIGSWAGWGSDCSWGIRKTDAGVTSLVSGTYSSLSPGTWYRVRLRLTGNAAKLDIFSDLGVLLRSVTASDPAITAGAIGFRNGNCTAGGGVQVDWLRVWRDEVVIDHTGDRDEMADIDRAGGRIVYVFNSLSDPASRELRRVAADGATSETPLRAADGRAVENPTWSPDGSLVLYSRTNNPGSLPPWNLAIARSASGFETLLTTSGASVSNRDGRYRPDGRKIVFSSDSDGDPEIWVMNADGSSPAALTSDPGSDREPDWWMPGIGYGRFFSATPTTTTSYTCVVTNEAGCTATDTASVTVSGSLSVTATSDSPQCAPNAGSTASVSLGGSTAEPGTYTWAWDFEDDGMWDTAELGGPSLVHSFPVGARRSRLRATSVGGSGCISTSTVDVIVGFAPSVSASSDSPRTAGEEVELSGSTSSSGTYTWSWDFEDDGVWDLIDLPYPVATNVYPSAGTYTARLRARNATTGCQASATTIVTIQASDSTPPSVPTVTDDGSFTRTPNFLHSTWSSDDPDSGISSYSYAIGSSLGGSDVVPLTTVGLSTEVTRTSLSLLDGQTYWFKVVATNGAGLTSTGFSNGIRVDASAPGSAFSNLIAGQELFGASFVIHGTAADSISGVQSVEVSADGGTTWQPATGTTSWSYDWTLPTTDGPMTLMARALDLAGNLQSTPTSLTVSIRNKPRPVSDLAAVDYPGDGGGQIYLSWRKSPDDGAGLAYVDLYYIYRGTSPAPSSIIGTVPGGRQYFTDTTTTDGVVYYYKVRAFASPTGKLSDGTAVGPVQSSDEPPAPPSDLNVLALTQGCEVLLSWTPSPSSADIQFYNVYSDGGTGTVNYANRVGRATHPSTTWVSSGLLPNQGYLFAVRAQDFAGHEETNTNVVIGVTTDCSVAAVRATIKNPKAGKRINGNSVTVIAELILGTVAETKNIRFQYQPVGGGGWTDIVPSNPNFPNPDSTAPYFVHWDVSAFPEADYRLRAVATSNSNVEDPEPPFVTVSIDHSAPDHEENMIGGERRFAAKVWRPIVNILDSSGTGGTSSLFRALIPDGSVGGLTEQGHFDARSEATTPFAGGGGSGRYQVAYDAKASYPANELVSLDHFREVSFDGGETVLEKSLGMNFYYSDANQDGIVDGTTVPETALDVFWWNATTNAWEQRLNGKNIQTQDNFIHAKSAETGIYGLFSLPQPAVVRGLRSDYHSDGISVRLTWSPVTLDVLGRPIVPSRYNVYRGTTSDFLPDLVGGKNRIGYSASPEFVDDSALLAGSSYYYLITAVDQQGREGYPR
jgi:Tol biopolymer transport system component